MAENNRRVTLALEPFGVMQPINANGWNKVERAPCLYQGKVTGMTDPATVRGNAAVRVSGRDPCGLRRQRAPHNQQHEHHLAAVTAGRCH